MCVCHRHWLHLIDCLYALRFVVYSLLLCVVHTHTQTSKLLNYFMNKTHNWCDARVYSNCCTKYPLQGKIKIEKTLWKSETRNNKLNWTNDTLAKVTYGVIKTRKSIHHWNMYVYCVCLSAHCFAKAFMRKRFGFGLEFGSYTKHYIHLKWQIASSKPIEHVPPGECIADLMAKS